MRNLRVRGLAIALVAVLAVGLWAAVAGAQTRFLSLSTGGPGGVYFPLGGAMADLLTRQLQGVIVTAESTAASVENARLVGGGLSDMGMVLGSVAYNARHGLPPFDQPLDIVALFQMYPAPQHIVTLKGSGIQSVNDMRGRRVSTEAPGSGAETIALAILDVFGIDPDRDFTRARLSQNESAEALVDGVVDAVFLNFAYPGAAVEQMATVRDIDLVSLEPDMLEKIIEKYPYFVPTVIPAGTYRGVDYDVLALGDSNVIVAHASMPEDVAYQIVKTIFENAEALHPVHPVAMQLTPQNGVLSPIPLHPGAERYFREVGALE
ncbi:MAG TPA: TAXI family TRAP transporter solute-binding subunit [Limnochordales bacterium]|nr:TAXI family TRAP transporter solute-binding subunit [Limnochordales bacterium]